jgi:hypothetical protein
MRARILLAGMLLIGPGCLNETTSQYRSADLVRPLSPQQAVQASTEAATRVDSLGRAIVARNPKAGVRPIFQTVGSPTPESFHRGTADIIITQKLVEMCPTDAELAAVLCLELGKMIAEGEALAVQSGRHAPLAPLDPGLPKEVTFDAFKQLELAKYERERGVGPTGVPDPEDLARMYLQQAGYPAESLDQIKAQRRAADRNSRLENQMTGRAVPTTSPFLPPQ